MKAAIRENIWGNWNGYLGGRKVVEFGTDDVLAEAWLASSAAGQLDLWSDDEYRAQACLRVYEARRLARAVNEQAPPTLNRLGGRKVALTLCGLNGNAYSLLATFIRAAHEQGFTVAETEAVIAEAKAGDYDHVVQTLIANCEDEEPYENPTLHQRRN